MLNGIETIKLYLQAETYLMVPYPTTLNKQRTKHTSKQQPTVTKIKNPSFGKAYIHLLYVWPS